MHSYFLNHDGIITIQFILRDSLDNRMILNTFVVLVSIFQSQLVEVLQGHH